LNRPEPVALRSTGQSQSISGPKRVLAGERRDYLPPDGSNSSKCFEALWPRRFVRTCRIRHKWNWIDMEIGNCLIFNFLWKTPVLFFLYMDFPHRGFAICKFFNETGGHLLLYSRSNGWAIYPLSNTFMIFWTFNFNCVSIRLPSEGGKCKDSAYLSEPLHHLYTEAPFVTCLPFWFPAWLLSYHRLVY
jgi:hypothetical protein